MFLLRKDMYMKNVMEKKWLCAVILAVVFFAGVCVGLLGSDASDRGTSDFSYNSDTSDTTEKKDSSKTDLSKSKGSSETTPASTPSVPREYKSALAKAKSYSDIMHMSKQGIYDQLTSEYGENFPADAAQYAIDNLNADYNKNALEKAKDYQKNLNMSTASIREQLISEYGEQFTEEEADYAISNLPQ